jgi:hypothetical protein
MDEIKLVGVVLPKPRREGGEGSDPFDYAAAEQSANYSGDHFDCIDA